LLLLFGLCKYPNSLSCNAGFTPFTINFHFFSSSLSCATFILLKASSVSKGGGGSGGTSVGS
jgi:hypothetical protein